MEDTATKLKQLSENLQQAQTKISKKKEEIEGKNKSLKQIEKELEELNEKIGLKVRERSVQFDKLEKEKLEKKKAIDEFKKIISSDKATLEKERDELHEKLVKVQTEAKGLETEKQGLLKGHNFEATKEEKKEEVKQEEEEESLESMKKGFKVNKDDQGILTVETLTRIVDMCTALAGKKFKEQVSENRKKLRSKGDRSLETYLDQAGKELSQHTQIYQEIENDLLKNLEVEKSLLDKSIEYYVKMNNFQVLALMNMLGEKLKSYLRGTKKIDNETFKKIQEAKIDFIEKEADKIFHEDNRRIVAQKSFANVSGNFAQKEEMTLLVLKNYFEFRLGAEIFDKFGVEEEDIREAAQNPEIQYDVDVTELLMKVEQTFYAHLPAPTSKQQQEQK